MLVRPRRLRLERAWSLSATPRGGLAICTLFCAPRESRRHRAAGSLGDRPVLVLSAGNIAAPSDFLEAWTNAQSDLARLSTRGRQIAVGGGASDLLHDAPDAIIEAVRQVVAEVRMLN